MMKIFLSCAYCNEYINIEQLKDIYICDSPKGCKNKNIIKYVYLNYNHDLHKYAFKYNEHDIKSP